MQEHCNSRSGSGMDCGSDQEIQVRFPAYPHCMLTPDGKEVKEVFRRLGARVRVEVGLARYRPLAAHGIGCLAAGLNLETGYLYHHYIAEIPLNMTLNCNQPKNTLVHWPSPKKHWFEDPGQ